MHQGSDHPLADDQRICRLTRLAQMYYDQNATQEATATSLNLSRPTVSRLLKGAREEGVVQIRIHSPFRSVPELETAQGQVCDTQLDSRTIGLSLGELSHVERSVAVVYGVHKAAGVLGALQGRLFNVLITDEATAQEVLRQYQEGQTHHD
jgi:DNA-binding transcriptional regulator LsrR (DeoR family)